MSTIWQRNEKKPSSTCFLNPTTDPKLFGPTLIITLDYSEGAEGKNYGRMVSSSCMQPSNDV